MSETKNQLLLQELMTTCTREFFESRGVRLRDANGATAAIERAAAIGFSGKEMRGVVGIGMETPTLHAIVSAQPLLTEKVSRDDWLAEAANQLLGRFKNKLIAHGAVVSIALPMVLRGIRMQFISIGAEGLWTYAADSDRGQVYVWLDVRMDEALVLSRREDPEAQSAAEGELVLF